MSDHEREELRAMLRESEERMRDFVREGLVAAMRDHPCRFGQGEAEVLHIVAHKMDEDRLTALALLARALNSTAARVGQIIMYGLLGAIVLGLAWLAKRGLLPDL